ncbi:hypothetical protein [Streptomyces sp. HUAS ZL42]|uniref:hypothetical protein n=1 Tax=Streptomyces sp. HUAS ZL42 TaxID=3231715 RepID=UPI00345ED6F7
MRPLTKIGGFTAALVVTFGAAYGIGDVIAPVTTDTGAQTDEHGGHTAPAADDTVPAGLQVSEDGYTLDLETPAVQAERRSTLRFVIRDAHGDPVTVYRTEHTKQLHLILASRDLTTYRHLHPTRAADGTWSVPAELPSAGSYRVFADFVPAAQDEGLTLGTDLTVTGRHTATELPPAAATATVDGYTVRLDGALNAGGESDLTFTVTRGGRPVTTLQPYLGAYGHLVALRSGDLAYLHVHPHDEAEGTKTSGPKVAFSAAVPSTGDYRLFLDFKVDKTVHTAAFTVRAHASS